VTSNGTVACKEGNVDLMQPRSRKPPLGERQGVWSEADRCAMPLHRPTRGKRNMRWHTDCSDSGVGRISAANRCTLRRKMLHRIRSIRRIDSRLLFVSMLVLHEQPMGERVAAFDLVPRLATRGSYGRLDRRRATRPTTTTCGCEQRALIEERIRGGAARAARAGALDLPMRRANGPF